MNRIYSKVWNASLGAVVVASELARSKSVVDKRRQGGRGFRLVGMSLAIMFALALAPKSAYADVCAGSFAPNNSPVAADDAFACGASAFATGHYSTAIGNETMSTGNYSVALGYTATAIGMDSMALGHDAFSRGVNSIAIGKDSVARNENSIALGAGSIADQDNTLLGLAVVTPSTK
jgi:trimeric autotransporter adhesin